MIDEAKRAYILRQTDEQTLDRMLKDTTLDEIFEAAKSVESKKSSPFAVYRLSELTEAERKPPEFIVDGVLPAGLTFLSGAPKLRKSFLALQLAGAVATGAPFLGFKTRKSGVLYLDLEGSKCRTASRAAKMGIDVPDNVLIANEIDCGIGDGLVEKLADFLSANTDARVVIVDTYSRARGYCNTGGANAYDADVQLLAPLQRLAIEKRVAVLCVHHDRKGAGFCSDSFERLSGTMAISGSCDAVLNLIADGKRFDGRARLEYVPREAKGGELSLRFDDRSCRWFVANPAEDSPLIEWAVSAAPSRGRLRFFSYADVYGDLYHRYSERPSEAILKAVSEAQNQLFTEHGIAIQTAVKSNDHRGIRIFRL